MSEPIQSISQGNYILQGTVATSAGIVGDGSPQNPLRVDETVLFETTAQNVSAVSLSEPLSSFERFRVIGGYGSTNWPETEFDTSTNLATPSMNLLFARAPGGFQWFKGNYTVSNDTKNITAVSARRLYINEGDSTIRWDSYGTYITKVVGINRINNA